MEKNKCHCGGAGIMCAVPISGTHDVKYMVVCEQCNEGTFSNSKKNYVKFASATRLNAWFVWNQYQSKEKCGNRHKQYEEHEYCKDVLCPYLADNCSIDNCSHSAKDFQHHAVPRISRQDKPC